MRGRLRNETSAWEKKLQFMSDLIAEMVKTMKDWRYLEPIFSSGDIINTMPAEGKMFKEVDSIWKTTM